MFIAVTYHDEMKFFTKYLKFRDPPNFPDFFTMENMLQLQLEFSGTFQLFWKDHRGVSILITNNRDLKTYLEMNKEGPYEWVCVKTAYPVTSELNKDYNLF